MNLDQNAFRLEVSLTYQLAKTSAAARRVLENLCNTHGELNVNQWKLLAIVAKFEPVRMADVTRWVTYDKASISRAASDLEALALVERVVEEDDRRLVILKLTQEGAKIYRAVTEELDQIQEAVFSGYGPRDIALFFLMLRSLDERLEAYQILEPLVKKTRGTEPATGKPRSRKTPDDDDAPIV